MQIRVSPNMYYLINAVRLLMSNDQAMDCTMVDASERVFELFNEFGQWDTKGLRVIKEFLKFRRDRLATKP